MALILGLVLITLPFLIQYFLPNYSAGIEIIAIVIIAYSIFSFMPTLASYLTAYDKKLKLISIFMIGLILSGFLTFIGYKNFGILGAGYFLIFTFFLGVSSAFLLVVTSLKEVMFWKLMKLFILFCPFLITLSLVYYINSLISFNNLSDDIVLLLRLSIFFILTSCPIFILNSYFDSLFDKITTLRN